MRTYKEFKCQFEFEPYLKHVSNSKIRKTLTRLRISCHRLFIETGRYNIPKIPAEDRLCKFCNLAQVEDETHFISVCPLYKQERENLYKVAAKESKHFLNLSSENKFVWLMCNENKDVCLQLATYVYKCFSQRSDKNN